MKRHKMSTAGPSRKSNSATPKPGLCRAFPQTTTNKNAHRLFRALTYSVMLWPWSMPCVRAMVRVPATKRPTVADNTNELNRKMRTYQDHKTAGGVRGVCVWRAQQSRLDSTNEQVIDKRGTYQQTSKDRSRQHTTLSSE